MSSKHIINSVDRCLDESLRGFFKLHPHLSLDFGKKIVFDPDPHPKEKVALISGSAGGHEPFPSGYVGDSMLMASVSGPIFSSPYSKNILHGIYLGATKCPEVLLVVLNCTTDVLHFGLAVESAASSGIKADMVVFGDDVAQEIKGTSKPEKRGMCGLVLALKIVGYFKGLGNDMATLKHIVLEVSRSSATLGMCVSPCSKPGFGRLFNLNEDEIEIGMGVRGEIGFTRVKMLPAHDAVDMLLNFLCRSLNLEEGNEVVAMLNNLGSLSLIEQWLLAGELEEQLRNRKISVARLYAGRFFTSLNMAGAQICLLKLNPGNKQAYLMALDYPTSASAWPHISGRPSDTREEVDIAPYKVKRNSNKRCHLTAKQSAFLKLCFLKISEDLELEEDYLNRLDTVNGDGDCGTSLKRLADVFRTCAERSDCTDPSILFANLSAAVEESVHGATGALYGLFLRGCNRALENFQGSDIIDAASQAWKAGLDSIKKYSSARIGCRTMVDSLEPGYRVFENDWRTMGAELAFRNAVQAATEGCESTKNLEPVYVRTSFVQTEKGIDAGAFGVTVWLKAIEKAIEES